MKGLEGQELRKSRLPWPSLPSTALTPAFGLLRSQLQCTVPGTGSAEALNQGFPKVQEKVLRKVSITEDHPWREGLDSSMEQAGRAVRGSLQF